MVKGIARWLALPTAVTARLLPAGHFDCQQKRTERYRREAEDYSCVVDDSEQSQQEQPEAN